MLDFVLGEPRRAHPLVGIGQMAHFLQCRLNFSNNSILARLAGVLAVTLMLWPAALALFIPNSLWGDLLSVFILYICISPRSLIQHGLQAHHALSSQDWGNARRATANLVSRDVDKLDEAGMIRAVTESVLENGSDGIFAPLFWFVVAGPAGVIVYRIVNTLDAMWGYKHMPYLHFGWCAARLDDAMNFLPARMTAFLYTVSHLSFSSWKRMRQQARLWESSNAGYAIASGAWALDISLGGNSFYQGRQKTRPTLGGKKSVEPDDIKRAHALILRSLFVFIVLLGVASVFA